MFPALTVLDVTVLAVMEAEKQREQFMFLPGTSMVVIVSGVSRKSTFPLWKVLL